MKACDSYETERQKEIRDRYKKGKLVIAQESFKKERQIKARDIHKKWRKVKDDG